MTLFRDDPELLAAFRRGERLDVVYRHYRGPLGAHFRMLVRRSSTTVRQDWVIQDLLQEAFLRAFSVSARNAYDGVRDFWPYLKTIAHHCVVDLLRRHRRPPLAIVEERLAGDEEVDLDAPESQHLVALLGAHLAGLSPTLQGVYEKRFVLGLSQHAASQLLGISRRSLRTLEERLRGGARRALLPDMRLLGRFQAPTLFLDRRR
jgi:RNA polymerase sigma factor (sigma-70 family)